MIRHLGIFLCLLLICACGSKTTVILLPQEDGRTGSVIVKTPSSSIILDKPYTYTRISDDRSNISVKYIGQNEVADQYHLLLKAEPPKPVHFILYFKSDSTDLTNEALALIPQILKSAKERAPSEINVIGHTDSKGSGEYNIKLSLERAKTVAKILREADADIENIYVQSYGENDPLVLTEDNVSEPKNRRVEIMIR